MYKRCCSKTPYAWSANAKKGCDEFDQAHSRYAFAVYPSALCRRASPLALAGVVSSLPMDSFPAVVSSISSLAFERAPKDLGEFVMSCGQVPRHRSPADNQGPSAFPQYQKSRLFFQNVGTNSFLFFYIAPFHHPLYSLRLETS